jgi:CRP/FNR family cyclic AMP-dependent transcriptional regulator
MSSMLLKEDHLHLGLFKGLTEQQLYQISSLLEPRPLEKQQVIFNQGDIADYFYILLEGRVAIRYKPYDGPVLTIAKILPGGVFGWSAALGRSSYTSSAIALLEGKVYCIADNSLHTICDLPDGTGIIFLERLTGLIAKRLQQTHNEILNILIRGTNCYEEGQGP